MQAHNLKIISIIKITLELLDITVIDRAENLTHTLNMILSELLESDLVFPKIGCASKEELISKLVEKIYSSGRILPLPPEELLDKIQMREQIGGTLLPTGLSVPHVRLNYEGFVITLASPKEPIFHEGIQVRLMALMISSQSGGPHYLPTLAALTKISRDADYLSRLCAAGNPEDFISILKERDSEL